MEDQIHTEVLIVGGGPVGLTLAIDLAQRGVDATIVEIRGPGEPPSVRCNHVAARTMETFRRLGLAQAVRNAGLPAHYPNDVSFRTTAIGMEMARIPIPCRAERYTTREGPDTWWPTPEPPHRINQVFLEPVMFRHAAAMPHVTILSRTRVVGREAYELNLGQFCCGGLNFGYFYEDSPITLYDGHVAPKYTMYEFKQSTVPGCRTPHMWFRDGRSLYDALGPEFTLLRFNPKVDLGAFLATAAKRFFPLVVLDVDAHGNRNHLIRNS